MQRRSSGSSDGDVSPVKAPNGHPNAVQSSDVESRLKAPSQHQRRQVLDRRKSSRESSIAPSTRSRRSGNFNWKPSHSRNGSFDKLLVAPSTPSPSPSPSPLAAVPTSQADDESDDMEKVPQPRLQARRTRSRNPWSMSPVMLLSSLAGLAMLAVILYSLVSRQIDPKGCRMSYMRPSYAKIDDFDTEHTQYASKYSLYLYREEGIDYDTKLRGIPVLFIPGNAGSYKQVRPIASEAAKYFHDVVQHDESALRSGARSLDFFTVDFNEDFSAFHGQTLLDQAEYLNEAIRYILSLYLDPRWAADRDSDLPDPTSVIILGHSMGGIVARTMLIMPNYQSNSINTILTMAAPHARPPVTFDGQLVQIYKDINDYWRRAYSQQWANNNPLWHVTLVSIAGGGLDTVVPSDYASLESLVPETHGFTVFTTTIPNVWTSMDHQAILWCDQFRKVIARALFDVVDVNRATQTKPRAERMRVFKKWLLTGLEDIAEKTVLAKEASTLLTLEDTSHTVITQGEHLVIRKLGLDARPHAYLLPVPPAMSPDKMRFTLLTDQRLDDDGEAGKLDILLCTIHHLQPGHAGMVFSTKLDLSSDGTRLTQLACKNAAPDAVTLPASTRSTKYPFVLEEHGAPAPFSYLEFDVNDICDHHFVAVVDKGNGPAGGFVVAEFSNHSQFHRTRHISLRRLLAFGMHMRLPPNRPMVTEVKIPSVQSSLLAYHLEISNQECDDNAEIFAPLVRQYLAAPYESKFFVNAREASVSIHGVAPYLPPPLKRRSVEGGLTFQFWTDPTCDSSIRVRLTVDFLGSLGKLYMRYRTVFAAFPLLVVALVLRKQFRVYDNSGVFIPFSESLDLCLRQSIPLMLASLTILSVSGSLSSQGSAAFWHWRNSTSTAVDFHQNDLLVGTQDPFFWFMIPLIGIICVGACTILNYLALALTQSLGFLVGMASTQLGWSASEERRRAAPAAPFSLSSRRRMITVAVLLFIVSTLVPYQFAYLVACIVQLFTTARASRVAVEVRSGATCNFYNYAHSIFMLMLWVLPINMPVLVVWSRNLMVRWLTPFSSHHNVLSIAPFIFLVEAMTAGKMVPRVQSRMRHLTSLLLFGIAVYAAVYGVSYAYVLHYLIDLVAAWLVVIHSTSDSWSLSGLGTLFDGSLEDRKRGKTP